MPRRKREAGTAIVETALVLPVLLLLVLGVADFGRVFYASMVVNNAARAGAGYATFMKYGVSAFPDVKAFAAKDASSSLRDFKATNVTVMNYCMCPEDAGLATYDTSRKCADGSVPAAYIKVDTQYAFTTLVNWPGIPNTVNLAGEAIMRVQ